MRETEPPRASNDIALTVRLPDGRVLEFSAPFYIGREPGCEIQLDDVHVSRRHAEILRLRGQWVVRDLQSSNGLFVDGERVDAAPVGEGVTITLGADGPMLQIDPGPLPAAAPAQRAERTPDERTLLDAYARRYFEAESDEPVGDRTMMIRKAFRNIQQQQTRRHRVTMAAVALVALCAVGYAVYAYWSIRQLEANAQQNFYDMKMQEVQFAELEQTLARRGQTPGQQQVAQYLEQRDQLDKNYRGYAARLYDRRLNESERLILRVTRLFGECEVAAPPDYIREVSRYIEGWKSSRRFERAVKLAQERGYPEKIAAAFIARGLPPQYFYLAMQESDFKICPSGSLTRWGYAKGMWQFIPETGRTYGLKIGPLEKQPVGDPDDDRCNWEKATDAAAKYVKDIYTTDAQASGLLVMASYNWGERRVIDLLRTMPADPRERNFWKLLAKHRDRVPPESYNYVFSIVSAAVIGENPKLFGVQIENPLKFAARR